jgi:hypothetical protein
MWKILQEQNRLNRIAGIPDIADIIPVMDDLLTAIEKDRPAIPVGHYAEIRFEELEKEPVESIRQLYSDLALPFPASFGDEIRKMGTGMNPFPKNSFTLTEDEKQVITTALAWHIERFGYNT